MLDYFFLANDITDGDKMKAILLSGVGATTYSLMRSLLCPQKPSDKTYKELVDLLKAHFNPKPSEIVQRFKFNSRVRRPGETVADYVAELRKLAQHCNYGEALTQMLRDRLVCGVGDDSIQRRLLAEVELTFEKALKISQAMESANKDIRDLQGHLFEEAGATTRMSRGHATVHRVSSAEHKVQQRVQACYRCKGQHSAAGCRFAAELCHNCGKRGHIKRACRSKPAYSPLQKGEHRAPRGGKMAEKNKRAHLVREESENNEEDASEIHTIYSVRQQIRGVEPITKIVKVNGTEVTFEVDTGCGVTVISKEQYSKMWKKGTVPELDHSSLQLKTYTGEKLGVLGRIQVTVEYEGATKILPLIVVEGDGPNLLGRAWLKELALEIHPIHKVAVKCKLKLEEVLGEHADVFKEELGQLKGTKATIQVDKEAQPKFYKPRPVPYAVKPLVEQELQRLVEEKIIEPVQFSDWAAPIVPVIKPDGSIRICGDYKVTVNRVSSLEQYPIPRVEDLLASLAGGEKFSKLDMSHAYQQIVLDEGSRKYVTINTHKGLYTYSRLPFGVASSPAIFQRTMEGILQGIPNVAVYLDDILVSGPTEEEHLHNLKEVLQRLESSGLRLKRSKCTFLGKEVVFLGHKIDATGLHPVNEKVAAIKEAPEPRNVTELKAYLGLLNYYHRFLPKLSTLLAPLHLLLRKENKWKWGTEQQKAFDDSKVLMQSCSVLVHYDPNKDLILACDASPYGVGAVLSHRMRDGSEKPIGFVSRTLTAAEKNYSQLDKEGLAVLFGVKKFHSYLYGRRFTIVTDHKPLISLFNEMKAVPQMASPRIQRWAVTLRAYEYAIVYKAGKDHSNADAFSRLPVPTGGEQPTEEDQERVLLLADRDAPLVTAEQDKDPATAPETPSSASPKESLGTKTSELEASCSASSVETPDKTQTGSRSVAQYALGFRTVAAGSGWNEPALRAAYRNGLNLDIRKELVYRVDSLSLEELIVLTIRHN
ncbi:hypothetical protein NFI96_020671 [Prochilodus magdalenae]|nr:hypothetical protein NFI96_020671 [Prochilodus magdalenae]